MPGTKNEITGYFSIESPSPTQGTKMLRRSSLSYENKLEMNEDNYSFSSQYDEETSYSSQALQSENEGTDEHEVVEPWPQPIVARPTVSSLVKLYAPRMQKPEPLSAETLAAYDEYKKKSADLNTAHSANCAAAKKIVDELATLEESDKGVNKWAARGARDAQKKRLETDLAAAEAKKEASKAAIEAHKAAGEDLRELISSTQKAEEDWEEMEKGKSEIARLAREAMEAVEQDMEEWRAAHAVAVK